MLYKKLTLLGLLTSFFLFSSFVLAEEESSFLFKDFNIQREDSSKEFIDTSFDDLFNIFGNYNTLTDSQKEESWYKYKGKYVRWQGVVTFKDVGENKRKRAGIMHKGGTNVELIFDGKKKDTVNMIKRGYNVTYTGKLSSLFNRNLLFRLEDANIELINGILIDELEKNQHGVHKTSSKPSHTTPAQIRSGENEFTRFKSKESSERIIDLSFDDLNKNFGKNSSLTHNQKEELWDNYKGKHIRWRGIVTYKGVGKDDSKRIGISHTVGTNAELIFDDGKKDIVKIVNRGDTITYTGKLAKLIGRNLLCSIVNVDIEKIGDKVINKAVETTLATSSSELPSDLDYKNKVINESGIIMAESMAPKFIKKDDIKITETLEGFIETSFEELDKIFGNENRMTESQKDKLWKEYKGKYVRWKGEVVNRGLGRVSGLRMVIKHKKGTDIELCFDIEKKDEVLQTKVGDTIIYTGKLVTRRGYILPYKLEDGNIENVEKVQLTADPPH